MAAKKGSHLVGAAVIVVVSPVGSQQWDSGAPQDTTPHSPGGGSIRVSDSDQLKKRKILGLRQTQGEITLGVASLRYHPILVFQLHIEPQYESRGLPSFSLV